MIVVASIADLNSCVAAPMMIRPTAIAISSSIKLKPHDLVEVTGFIASLFSAERRDQGLYCVATHPSLLQGILHGDDDLPDVGFGRHIQDLNLALESNQADLLVMNTIQHPG